MDSYDVPYTQNEINNTFQKKLTAGDHINIDSDGVISAHGFLEKYEAVYGTTTYSNIHDALEAGKEVVLRIDGGADDVSYATFGGAYSDPEYNEYYFYSLGKGAQDTVYRVNNLDTWTTFTPNDADGRVFIAEYNRTAFADIKRAINQGKYAVAKSGASYFWLNHDFDERIVFTGKNSLSWSDAAFVEVDSDDVWSYSTSAPPLTTFASYGSVIATDAWNAVEHTDSFALAQKGTHGGMLDLGVKLGLHGWSGTYKVFTRLYHDSTNQSAPASGTTEFSTVNITSTDYAHFGYVPQYMLQTGVNWTYIAEIYYTAQPGRSVRFTLNGVGSAITWLAEEIR